MSGLGTGCQGRGQGVGAGDRASRLTPPSLHQSVFGDKPSLPEYKVAAIRKPPLILLHYGAFKAGWDGLILLATLYVAVTVPYSVCVGAGGEEGLPAARGPPSACDLCVEILFMLGKAPPHLATHTLPYAGSGLAEAGRTRCTDGHPTATQTSSSTFAPPSSASRGRWCWSPVPSLAITWPAGSCLISWPRCLSTCSPPARSTW